MTATDRKISELTARIRQQTCPFNDHSSGPHIAICPVFVYVGVIISNKISDLDIWYVGFYRAMLCIHGTSHGPVSVCPSVCPSVRHKSVFYLKQLNVGSQKQHHTISQGLYFSDAKDLREIRPGSPPTRRQTQVGWFKIGDFQQITGYISRTVQDRHIVSIKVE